MPGRRGRKRCSEGASCPYKHEHQHQMEFYHDDDGENGNVSGSSLGGGSNTGRSGGHSSSFQAFSGSGRSLGSGGNTFALGGRSASTMAGRGRAAEAAMRRATAVSLSNAASSTADTSAPKHAPSSMDSSRLSKKRPAAPSRRQRKAAPSSAPNQDVIILDSDSDDYDDISEMNKKKQGKRKRTKSDAARKKKPDARTVSAASSSCDEGAIDLCDSDDDVVVVSGTFHQPRPAIPPPGVAGMSEDQQLAAAIALSNQTTNNPNSTAFQPTIPTASTRPAPVPPPRRHDSASLYGNASDSQLLAKAIANSNRDVMEDQDKEYYESLIADREKAAQKKRHQQAQQEKEELNTILEMSKKQAQQEDEQRKERQRMNAQNVLEPEPSYDDRDSCCFIAFRLPTTAKTNRVSRRFRQDAPVSQLFLYLRSLQELTDVDQWTVHKTTGGGQVTEDSKTTLTDAGFFPRVVLVVKDENV